MCGHDCDCVYRQAVAWDHMVAGALSRSLSRSLSRRSILARIIAWALPLVACAHAQYAVYVHAMHQPAQHDTQLHAFPACGGAHREEGWAGGAAIISTFVKSGCRVHRVICS